ncbi:MAG: hypothetical protein ABIH89_09435 [Elusimicrobiota bacterium]
MKISMIKKVYLLILFCVNAYLPVLAEDSSQSVINSTTAKKVDIFADSISCDQKAERIKAAGNVRVVHENIELFSDEIEYIKSQELIYALGNVSFKRDNYSLNADTMIYHIDSSTGTVYNTVIEALPMRIYAKEVIIKSSNEFLVPFGDITTCEHKPPHYSFRGKNIYLKTGSRLSATNTALLVRKMPVFFYPYYTRRLGPRKLEISADIGSSSGAGDFINTRFSYPFTGNSRSYAGLDLMTIRGAGFKAGHSYRTDKGYSDIDLYYINDKADHVDRGRVYARGWQELGEYSSIRYRTEYASNYLFNYDYDRMDTDLNKKELYYQLGLEYSRAKYTASIYGNKKEEWTGQEYAISSYVLPGAEFRLYSIRIPGNALYSQSVSYMNDYNTSSDKWEQAVSWNSRVDKTYRFNMSRMYYISLTPGLGFDGTYRTSLRRYTSMFMAMQHGLYNRFFVRGNYTWRRAVEYPMMIINNLLTYEIEYRPFPNLSLISASSYDFTEDVNEPAGDFYTRLRLYRGRSSLYLTNRYDYYDRITEEWYCDVNIRDISTSRLRYNYLYPDRLELGQFFTIKRFPYDVSVDTRFYMNRSQAGNYRFDEFIEKSLTLRRNLHCWDMEFKILTRGAETAFWVLFNIAAFPESRTGLYGNLLHKDYRYIRE